MAYICKKIDPYEHEEQLCHLWRRNLANAPPNRFKWLYQQSKNIAEVHTWGLFKEQKLCGCLSLMAKTNYVSKKPAQKGAMFFDFMTDKSERTLFPAMLLVREVLKDAGNLGFNYLLASPNIKARIVFKRCGLGLKGCITGSRWVKILDFQRVMPKCLPKLLSKNIAYFLGAGSYCVSYLLGHYTNTKFKITYDFPEFSKKGKAGERSFLYNNNFIIWRYQLSPIAPYEFFTVNFSDDVIVIIYHANENNIYIDKILFADNKNISAALNLFSIHMSKNKADNISISVAGVNLIRKQLKMSMFVPRPFKYPLMVIILSGNCQSLTETALLFDGDMDF